MQPISHQLFPWRKALQMLMAIMTVVPALLLSLSFLIPGIARAHGVASSTPPKNHVTVNSAVKHDVSPPLRSLKPVHTGAVRQHPLLHLPKLPQGAPNGLRDHVQNTGGSAAPHIPTPSNSFDGVGQGFTGPQGTFSVSSAPPDTNGSVGLQDYVQTVNTDFAVFNKDASRGPVGQVRYGPVQINTLWTGFGGLCEADNDGDPVVVYDSIANRWLISQFALTNNNPNFFQCVAVSTGSDPTGTYNRYAFSYTTFPDYPKIGLWPDAYYATFNMFNSSGTSFLGAEACAFDRTSMLSGASATQQCFSAGSNYLGMLPSSLDGATPPPAGSPNYLLALNTSTSLGLWKFHVDWSNPGNSTFTGPSNISVASYSEACGGGTCIPQSGTTNQLDSLADRLMWRLQYRNFGSYESLVVDHSVTSGSSVGMRWYEIRSPGGTPSVFQSGTYAPNSSYRWMGSISQDQSADMAMEFSISSSSLHPGISYTGRLPGDAPGTMGQGEASLIVGGGSQTGGLTRWGDYSSMSVDPSDGCTFWFTNQYIPSNGSFNWKTRIGSFKFPSCGTGQQDFSISANPTSLTIQQGSSGTSTINTTQIGSPGTVNLSDQVSPSGPTASQNPASIQAGQSSTLTVTVGSSVPPGTYTVTITGTEGNNTHSTTVTVTVTSSGSGDFSISANPSSLTIQQGSSGTSTINTTQVGNPGTVNLSAQVSPSGPTTGLNPSSIQAGQSSTLTVTVGSSVPVGTYTVTVTGTEGSNTHSTTVTVTVTSSGGGGIVNGGFETGNFNGWTTTGTTSISNVSHSGNYSGQAGGTSPTNGDSTISQTFTDPSGTSTLSFWYLVNCPDTVTYDWATATLKDNTNNTTSTILPKTCNQNGNWVQVMASVTAGHSYTLTLISHDDNYPGDPTYTLFDDVALSGSAPGDFSISANPSSLTIQQGSSGTSTINTTQVGNPGTVNLSAQVSPSGPTTGLNPSSIQAGQSSTLTVTVGSSVPVGTYTVTVTGTEGSNTHSTTVTVTVTSSGGGGIVNGGFETGNFNGWTTTGTTSISTRAHSGNYSGQAGGTSPTNGDSTISQTFTAPSGTSTLSFWYLVVCPDTVTYDWATATLKDNTTNRTTTILAKTCNQNGNWVQVRASVTAGHSYTLTLISHDDNYPGDPTYTLFDDVNVS